MAKEHKQPSGKGLRQPGLPCCSEGREPSEVFPPVPSGLLADLFFPSVTTQLGLWDFTSGCGHFFLLGLRKEKRVEIPPSSR